MQVILVAGGMGTRARAMTGDFLPKALLKIGDIPIIERQIEALHAAGATEILVIAGHMGHLIKDFIDAFKVSRQISITVLIEEELSGTAGAVIKFRDRINDSEIAVVYGDLLFEFDLLKFKEYHLRVAADISIACRPNDHPQTSDLLVVDKSNAVIKLISKKEHEHKNYRNLVPVGIYFINTHLFFSAKQDTKVDFFLDFFPDQLSANKKIYAYRTAEYICDIGTIRGWQRAEYDLGSGRLCFQKSVKLRPAIFFDCDGVINIDHPPHGITNIDQVKLIEGAALAIQRVNYSGYLSIGVTNRPQVAKGFISEEGLEACLGRLEFLLGEQSAYLDKIYYCPHHPDSGYEGEIASLKISCHCRKPETGLFSLACMDLPIDIGDSSIIGDSWRDIEFGRRAGINAYGVRTGYACKDGAANADKPHLMFENIVEAVTFCLSYEKYALKAMDLIDLDYKLKRSKPFLVGICGESQSGKSVLAHAIERFLKKNNVDVLRVELDDWIIPKSKRSNHMTVFERVQAHLYSKLYKDLRDCKIVESDGYSPLTRECFHKNVYKSNDESIILIEGILAGHAEAMKELDALIYVNGTSNNISERQLKLMGWKEVDQLEIDTLQIERGSSERNAIIKQLEYASAFSFE